MGQHTLNSIMKRMIENSPLRNSDKKLINHSPRKTLVKKLRKNYIPKYEIIGITSHNSEIGFDTHDSRNEEQCAISNTNNTYIIVIVCYAICVVINFEIYLIFFIKSFFYISRFLYYIIENVEQNLKYLEKENIF